MSFRKQGYGLFSCFLCLFSMIQTHIMLHLMTCIAHVVEFLVSKPNIMREDLQASYKPQLAPRIDVFVLDTVLSSEVQAITQKKKKK